MTVQVGRKGDLIELGANGAYRLEQAVIVVPNGDEQASVRPWKLYKRVDTNGVSPDEKGDDQPTAYTYRYDPAHEFVADDEEAAIAEAKRLIAEG